MNNGKADWKGNFVALVTPFTKEAGRIRSILDGLDRLKTAA